MLEIQSWAKPKYRTQARGKGQALATTARQQVPNVKQVDAKGKSYRSSLNSDMLNEVKSEDSGIQQFTLIS